MGIAQDSPDEDAPEVERRVHSESVFAVMLGQYAVMQAVVAAAGLVRNKVIALRLGPGPFGEVTQLAAVVAAVTAITSFGMQVSLSRNIARARSLEERQGLLASANGLVLSLSGLATAVLGILLVTGDFLRIISLSATTEIVVAAVLTVAAIPILGLQTNYLAVLQGVLDVKGLAVQRSLAVLAATVVSVPIVWVAGLVGAAAAFLILNVLLTTLLGLRCRALGFACLALRLEVNVVTLLASFGLASMASGFAQAFADTSIRTSLIAQYGTEANGLLQAPLVLAATLKAVVLGSVGSISLSSVSSALTREETSTSIDRLLNVGLPLSVAALGLLGLLGAPAMIVLYSDEFVGGAALLRWLLAADLLLVAVWVVGAPLLAAADRALWLGLDLVWAAARWAISILLLPVVGVEAVAIGMLLAVAGHFLLVLVAIRWRQGLVVRRIHGIRLLVGLPFVGLLATVGSDWRGGPLALVAAGGLWVAYCTIMLRSSPVFERVVSLVRRKSAASP